MVTYSCPACFAVYDTFDAMDTHRRTLHGRDGHGNLVIDANPAVEKRLARLEQQIVVLFSDMAALRALLEKRP